MRSFKYHLTEQVCGAGPWALGWWGAADAVAIPALDLRYDRVVLILVAAGIAALVGQQCYRCERRFEAGALLYHPVFRRGAEAGTETFSQLPDRKIWIYAACVAE